MNEGKKTADELTFQSRSQPVRFLAADICDPAQIQHAIDALRKFHDRVDILVNNAGVEFEKSIDVLTIEDWDLIMNVNLRGTIQDLADAVHLSCGHLSRVFRKTTGTTLELYLIQQRVELAKRALLDPRFNVGAVAERCGFCNPAYFASVFKKHVKCTPREFAIQPHRWEPIASSSLWSAANISSIASI